MGFIEIFPNDTITRFIIPVHANLSNETSHLWDFIKQNCYKETHFFWLCYSFESKLNWQALAEMSFASFGLIAIFSTILSFNLATCQYGYNNQYNGAGFGGVPTYSQTSQSTYQQPAGGQQTVVVQETVQQPNGVTKTVVTKTVNQPVVT